MLPGVTVALIGTVDAVPSSTSLLSLCCVDVDAHLYYVAIQNQVCKCGKVRVTAVATRETSLTRPTAAPALRQKPHAEHRSILTLTFGGCYNIIFGQCSLKMNYC